MGDTNTNSQGGHTNPSPAAKQPFKEHRWLLVGCLILICLVSILLVVGIVVGPGLFEPGPTPSAVTATPMPTPSTLGERAKQVVDELFRGQIVYNKPDAMQVGEPAQIQALLIEDTSVEATEKLKQYLEESGAPASQIIQVSALMRVRLVPQDKRDFRIEPLHSEEDQPVGSIEPTSWSWRVTPLRSGERVLYLRATAMVEIPGEPTRYRDLPSQTITIPVEVNPAYSAQQAITTYWWVSVPIILVVLGAIGLRKGYFAGLLGRRMQERDYEPTSPRDPLAEARENLRLIQERKGQYVLETDIPLQLIKEERQLLERVEELERAIGGEPE